MFPGEKQLSSPQLLGGLCSEPVGSCQVSVWLTKGSARSAEQLMAVVSGEGLQTLCQSLLAHGSGAEKEQVSPRPRVVEVKSGDKKGEEGPRTSPR